MKFERSQDRCSRPGLADLMARSPWLAGICPGVEGQPYGWMLLYQCKSKTCPTDSPTGQPDGGVLSAEVSSSQITLAWIKLTKPNQAKWKPNKQFLLSNNKQTNNKNTTTSQWSPLGLKFYWFSRDNRRLYIILVPEVTCYTWPQKRRPQRPNRHAWWHDSKQCLCREPHQEPTLWPHGSGNLLWVKLRDGKAFLGGLSESTWSVGTKTSKQSCEAPSLQMLTTRLPAGACWDWLTSPLLYMISSEVLGCGCSRCHPIIACKEGFGKR